MGILLVYDVTDESSFNNIKNWVKNIEAHASEHVVKVRAGGGGRWVLWGRRGRGAAGCPEVESRGSTAACWREREGLERAGAGRL